MSSTRGTFRNRSPNHKEMRTLFMPSPYQTSLERLEPQWYELAYLLTVLYSFMYAFGTKQILLATV